MGDAMNRDKVMEALTFNGVKVPERILLTCDESAGDVCWVNKDEWVPDDDFKTVEYVRAQSPDPAEEALRNIIASSEANDGDSLMNAIEDAKALLRTKAFGWGRITTAALSAPKENPHA